MIKSTIEISATEKYEVVIVGSGIAGLSAGVFLARAGRKVLIFDGGPIRMSVSAAVHEFIGHDGLTPAEMQMLHQNEFTGFGGELRREMVTAIKPVSEGEFRVSTYKSNIITSAVILATGLVDVLPDIPGLRQIWGIDLHICPCFNGYELAGKRLVAFGLQEQLAQSGKFLTGWTSDVTVISPESFDAAAVLKLKSAGVNVVKDEVTEIVLKDDRLVAVKTKEGSQIYCEGIFISAAMRASSELAESLCDVDGKGFALTDGNGQTSVAGIWAVGNATDPMGHLVHAAATGTQAGPYVHDYLIERSLWPEK